MTALPDVPWKVGLEIELMAPPGRTRRDLAQAIAGPDRSLRTFWHIQSEPSAVPGMDVFHNLTPGFEVPTDTDWEVRVVDDLTLQRDLDRRARPKRGWQRIVSDDLRLLRLIQRHADAESPLDTALSPVAALWGTEVEAAAGGIARLTDGHGASICLGAPLPGERERPAELVTCPMEAQHFERLAHWLGTATRLGFSVPHEAAVHVHCDAARLRDPGALQRLARLWLRHRTAIRERVRTNPACVRLGPWSEALQQFLLDPALPTLDWEAVCTHALPLKPTKYCDLNLANLLLGLRDKPTVEFRIFPGHRDPRRLWAWAHLAAALCMAAVDDCDADDVFDLPTLHPLARAVLVELL